MRVAFDVGPLWPEPAGVGHYVVALADALAEGMPRGSLAFIGRRSDAADLPPGFPVMRRSSLVPYPVWNQLASAVQARQVRADVVHYTDGLVPPVRHGRVVVTVHDLSVVREWRTHPGHRWARIPFVLASPHLADVVIVPSRATADEVIKLTRVPASKVHVTPEAPRKGMRPMPADEAEPVVRSHRLEPGRYLLALGTIEPRKNYRRLVTAFEQLINRGEIDDDVMLVIAGGVGWRSAELLAAIDGSPHRGRIRRLGYVPDHDLPALLSAAAAAVFVSLYEGFGLPVVEAMACGTPIVTSNVSSMPEVAGDAGFLVDPYHSDDIAQGLREAMRLAGPERAAVARRCVQQAGRFSWAAAADHLAQQYAALA